MCFPLISILFSFAYNTKVGMSGDTFKQVN